MEGRIPRQLGRPGEMIVLEEHPRMQGAVMLFLQAVTLPGLVAVSDCDDWQREAMLFLAPHYAQLQMMAGRCPWSGKK